MFNVKRSLDFFIICEAKNHPFSYIYLEQKISASRVFTVEAEDFMLNVRCPLSIMRSSFAGFYKAKRLKEL
jgi:hypothetical protein